MNLKSDWLIEYNKRNFFFQKSCNKWDRETSSRPLFVFEKTLYDEKESDLQLSFNIFWLPSAWHTIKIQTFKFRIRVTVRTNDAWVGLYLILKERKIIVCVKSLQIRSFFWYVFSPNTGKYGPEKILYLDTFHADNNLSLFQD